MRRVAVLLAAVPLVLAIGCQPRDRWVVRGQGMGVLHAAHTAPVEPRPRFPVTRTQVHFIAPDGMQIGWQVAVDETRTFAERQITVPGRYNFEQGAIYRLKLTNIPGREGVVLYPTLEVAPRAPASEAYLAHNAVPVEFTDEDFDQVVAGNFVTKVIYLPDPEYQELAIAGVETLVSTRLAPGVDPIAEADRRGTILVIVRMGAIDLELPGASPVYHETAEAGKQRGFILPIGAEERQARGEDARRKERQGVAGTQP
jgi:hypothetical protein